jgi:queuine tRNA-ribosyltransferase
MGTHFKIIKKDGLARAGVLKTAHGYIKTPVFMPVGTQASVKALSPDDLKEAGAQIILGNTYHLYLRPGSKLVKEMGGLHKFMNWDGPILTDSGGFQAFSLGAMIEHGVRKVPRKESSQKQESRIKIQKNENKILKQVLGEKSKVVEKGEGGQREEESANISEIKNYKIMIQSDIVSVDNRVNSAGNREKEGKRRSTQFLSRILTEGVEFKSHLDGSKHLLTPQKSIEVQLDLGSDICLVLDELLSPLHPPLYVKSSLERTHRWELESKDFFEKNVKSGTNPGAQLFGILQGVYDKEIREQEANWIAEQGFDGVSIGGSFGTSEFWGGSETDWAASKAIYDTVGWVSPLLPDDMPRHILGIGEVQDFFECIERGADMFDCVSPTRRARNGSLYIQPKNGGVIANKFTLAIGRAEYLKDSKPIDPGCECYTCQNFSRSYLRHLFMAGELLFFRLATIHNVYFMLHLVDTIRESIIEDQFEKLKKSWLN